MKLNSKSYCFTLLLMMVSAVPAVAQFEIIHPAIALSALPSSYFFLEGWLNRTRFL